MAAVLACGEGAALSHRAAGALLGLLAPSSRAVDVTVQRAGGRQRRGIAVHRTRSLPAIEVTWREGIPCTTVARTLVDLSAVLSPQQLDRALEQAEILRILDLASLEAAMDRARGRRGVRTLRRMIDDLHEPPPVRRELERMFLALVRDAGLPAPAVNAPIGEFVVDFHWRDARLVVETDGRATHDTPHAFEEDRRRDLALTLAGWHVVRLSWRQVVEGPRRVAALLRSRLRAT